VFHTPADASDSYRYMWYSIIGQQSITLKIRACSDVRIILARHFLVTDYDVLEIVIGASANSVSMIRSGVGGSIVVEEETRSILHCTAARWFWIDWSHGISVGSDAVVGDRVFMSMINLPQVFDIESLSISTRDALGADWEFSTVPGLLFCAT
jgi:Farnesoic acid 0-methyl transferase